MSYTQMARMVATKAALSIRVDALTDPDGKSEPDAPSIGIENRAKLESRLRALEHQGELDGVRRFADGGKKQAAFRMTGPTKTYNTAGDAVVDEVLTTQRDPVHAAVQAVRDVKEEKRRAKEERRAKRRAEKEKAKDEEPGLGEDEMDVDGDMDEKERKREKKRKRRESDAIVADAVTEEVSQFRSGDILPRIDVLQVTKEEEPEAERKARKKARKAEKAKGKTPGGSATANGEVHEKKKKKKEEV